MPLHCEGSLKLSLELLAFILFEPSPNHIYAEINPALLNVRTHAIDLLSNFHSFRPNFHAALEGPLILRIGLGGELKNL